MKSVKRLALIGLFACTPLTVMADEVWETSLGEVVYQSEEGSTAVWTYGEKDKNPGVIYILGLSKVYENRGQFEGYWAKNKSLKACDSQRMGVDGAMTNHWGRFQITFIDKDFPSRWKAKWSFCNGEFESTEVLAKPVVGE